MTLTPAQILARAEPVALANAGTFGEICGPCARPVGVQYVYDDPLNTPVTDLELRLVGATGEEVLPSAQTQGPMSHGLDDVAEGVGALRPTMGRVIYGQASHSAGMITAEPNPSQDIESAADDAWEIEQDIAGKLWDFEQEMRPVFGPYVEEWKTKGWSGVASDFANGVGRGIQSWWDGESEFWGSAWGWLKSTTAAVGGYVYDGVANGPVPNYLPNAAGINLGIQVGSDVGSWVVGLFEGVNVMDYITPLHDLMRAFLFGDIDGIIAGFQRLTGLKDIPGAIGEFGQMIADVVANGVDTMRDMVEMIRRTPILGLIASTFMRVVLMMTPNFWAKVMGEGTGFIIPELIIWAVTAVIAALSAGAGAGALAIRAAGIASKIRGAIKGSKAVGALLRFMDELYVIIGRIKDMGLKLRQSIDEIAEGIVDVTQRKFLTSRLTRQKLARLKTHGPGAHGVQRHEGDVTVRQLNDRCMHGKDPMTGSTTDGVTGRPHNYSADATKVKTPTDFVRAYEKALENPVVKAQMAGGKENIRVNLPIKDLLGHGWQTRILGRSRVGSRRNPTGSRRTVFPSNTEMFVYLKKKTDGSYYLNTMFPTIP